MERKPRITIPATLALLLAAFTFSFSSCDMLAGLMRNGNGNGNGQQQSGNDTEKEVSDIQFKPTKSVAQKADYSAIDSYVRGLNISTSASIANAAAEITQTATDDKEKARAIFTWICENIAYDSEHYGDSTNYNHREMNTAEATFTNRKALCEGYAKLFKEMCDAIDLEADYVSGYDKKSGFEIHGEDYKQIGNHAWNIVYGQYGYFFVDTTWGAGGSSGDAFVKNFKDSWFDVDPAYMILSHWPQQTSHQLLDKPLGYDDFCELPRVNPSWERLGVDGSELLDFLLTHKKAWAPNSYSFLETLDYGVVKAVNIPMTDYLSAGTPYTFDFTGPALYLKRANPIAAIEFGSPYTLPEKNITGNDVVNLFYNGKGLLSFTITPGKESSGLGRTDRNKDIEENESRSDYTKIGKAKVFFFDDTAKLIDSLIRKTTLVTPYFSDGKYTYHHNGGLLNANLGGMIEVWEGDVNPFTVYGETGQLSCALYDPTNQWWHIVDEGCALTEELDVIASAFEKLDDSIPYARMRPKTESDISVCVVPLSQKEEYVKKIEAFINYDWHNDKGMVDFVSWMEKKNYSQNTINFYTQMAEYPSQRGFRTEFTPGENYWEDFTELGADSYYAGETVCAGGMERYFAMRELCDSTIFRQEEIPFLILHFVDTSSSAVGKAFTPWTEVTEIAKILEDEYNSFMPTKLKCHIVNIPLDYSERPYPVIDKAYILNALQANAPSVYSSVNGKRFAWIEWYDDDNYSHSNDMLRYSANDNPWHLFSALVRGEELMGFQHSDLFANDDDMPPCMANDCLHTDDICPLCLYSLGF